MWFPLLYTTIRVILVRDVEIYSLCEHHLLPFMGKAGGGVSADTTRRTIINTIGPHWDGNEVWLLAAGGATDTRTDGP